MKNIFIPMKNNKTRAGRLCHSTRTGESPVPRKPATLPVYACILALCALCSPAALRGDNSGLEPDDIPKAVSTQSKEMPHNVVLYTWVEGLSSGPGAVKFAAKTETNIELENGNDSYKSGQLQNMKWQDANLALSGTAAQTGEWISSSTTVYLPVTTGQEISYREIETTNLSKSRIHVKAPDEYNVYLYNKTLGYYEETSVIECDSNTSQILYVVKPKAEQGLPAGKDFDILHGTASLRMGLGWLPNGKSAGYLDFDAHTRRFGTRDVTGSYQNSSWSFFLHASYKRAIAWMALPGRVTGPFYCFSTDPGVKLVLEEFAYEEHVNRRIRQILTPSVLVDIKSQESSMQYIFTVDFYHVSTAPSFNGSVYDVSTWESFVSYEFAVNKNPTYNTSLYNYTDCSTQTVVRKINVTRTEGSLIQEASFEKESLSIMENFYAEDCVWTYTLECDYETYVICGGEGGNGEDMGDAGCVEVDVLVCEDIMDTECDEITDDYQMPIPRKNTFSKGFSGEKCGHGASYHYNSAAFNGDSYHIDRTDSSLRLVGWHGSEFTYVPSHISTKEIEYQFTGSISAPQEFEPDLPNGNYGYRMDRQYYDMHLDTGAKYPGQLYWEEKADRSWTMFGYHTDKHKRGLVSKVIAPFCDTERPETPPANNASGYRIKTIDYAADWNGAVRLPSVEENWVDGIRISKAEYTHQATGTANGQPVWQTTTVTWAEGATSVALTSISKVYQGKNINPMYRGLPFSMQAANDAKTSYAYEQGIVDSSGNFTYSGTGSAFRSIAVTGVATSGSTISLSNCTQTIDAINFVDERSTRTETIRNEWGLVTWVKSYVYSTNSWLLMDTEKRAYDTHGNLILSENSASKTEFEYTDENNDSTSHAAITFANNGTHTGRLQYTKDASGVITKYTYDNFGRVTETLRLAMPASGGLSGVPELLTQYTYDADGRITSKTIGPDSSEQLVSTYTYNFAGQLVSKIEQGIKTAYSYGTSNVKILSVKKTFADGSNMNEIRNADGNIQSKTGTGIIPEHYEYSVESASLSVKASFGDASSPRWSKTWTDGLERIVRTQQSAAISPVDTFSSYNAKGQLTTTVTGSLAPTLYTYDSMGVMNCFGQNITRSGTLGTTDRIHSFDYGIRHDPNVWSRYPGDNITLWDYAETFAYPDGVTVGSTLTRTWTRLNNFSAITPPAGVAGTLVAETITADAEGNRSATQIFLDRANGVLTTVVWSPFATQPAITVSLGGLMMRQITAANVQTEYQYDSLCRPVKVIDRTSQGYSGDNLAYIPGSTRIHTITDNCGVIQHTYAYDPTGRLVSDSIPDINQTTGQISGTSISNYAYNNRGQLTRAWGDVLYPVRYEYDPDTGDRTAQYTFRASAGDASSGGDKTTFTHQPETGLLTQRKDAANKTTDYTYNTLGQLATRAWSRSATTAYTYNNDTGELTQASYSDGTPTLTYAHDRLGRIKTVTDATGTRTITYRPVDQKPETEILGTLYSGTGVSPVIRQIANQYDPTTGRFTGIKIQTQTGSGAPPFTDEHTIAYAHDPASARLASITSASGTHTYSYLANSNLISAVSTGGWTQTRAYETNRDLLTDIITSTSTSNLNYVAAYGYVSDALGRRRTVDQTGQLHAPYTAAGQTMQTAYTYNQRNETIGAVTTVSGTVLPGRSFGYTFDPIGNRTTENIDGVSHTYDTNNLNQYTQRATPWWLPVSGMADNPGGVEIEVSGTQLPASAWMNWYFHKAEPKDPANAAHTQAINLLAQAPTGETASETRHAKARPVSENFTYDLDGNLTTDSLWHYAYDAENRLKWMRCLTPDENGDKVSVEFTYDYMSRRVAKDIYHYTGADPSSPDTRAFVSRTIYLYQGWTLLCEYSGTGDPPVLQRRFIWGIDLSCTLGGAGDIGGLLAIEDLRLDWQGAYHPAYDGNGNLTALTDAATSEMVAAYEYDPFGNHLRASGDYAKENPIRFAGKYYDTETSLSYYGYRFYSASLGRFINRDPLEERGGWALYKALNYRAANPFAAVGTVDDVGWSNDWEQTQARLLGSAQTPNLSPEVNFKSFQSKDSPFGTATAPTSTVTNPALGNIDINLYIYAGNNPINAFDALGLFGSSLHDGRFNNVEKQGKGTYQIALEFPELFTKKDAWQIAKANAWCDSVWSGKGWQPDWAGGDQGMHFNTNKNAPNGSKEKGNMDSRMERREKYLDRAVTWGKRSIEYAEKSGWFNKLISKFSNWRRNRNLGFASHPTQDPTAHDPNKFPEVRQDTILGLPYHTHVDLSDPTAFQRCDDSRPASEGGQNVEGAEAAREATRDLYQEYENRINEWQTSRQNP